MEEKHVCFYCGQEASHQLKNGNWCCEINARSCPIIRDKVSKKTKEKWNFLKKQGIKNRKEIPEEFKNKKRDLGKEGICFYCGGEAKYQLKNGRWSCKEKYQQCPSIREKNSKKQKQITERGCGGFSKFNSLIKTGELDVWNKGLTKETDVRLQKSSNTYKRKYADGEIKSYWKGKMLPKEMREKISISMKKAHSEGRAHNIGKSRWNNEPSYPEQFFMKVIENEFVDKDYKREFCFIKYSLDFAWVHKKRVIEIDGEQHERFEEYKNRDKEKDKLLQKNGWKVFRIKWKDMYNDTKYWINKAKMFIDCE